MILAAAEEGVPRAKLCELLETGLLTVRDPLHWAQRLREAGCGPHAQQRLFPPLEALLRREPRIGREGLAALEGAVDAGSPGCAGSGDHRRPRRARCGGCSSELGISRETGRLARARAAPIARERARGRRLVRQLVVLRGRRSPEARGFEAPWVEVAQAEAMMALEQVREIVDSLAGLQLGGRPLTHRRDLRRLVRDALSQRRPPAP